MISSRDANIKRIDAEISKFEELLTQLKSTGSLFDVNAYCLHQMLPLRQGLPEYQARLKQYREEAALPFEIEAEKANKILIDIQAGIQKLETAMKIIEQTRQIRKKVGENYTCPQQGMTLGECLEHLRTVYADVLKRELELEAVHAAAKERTADECATALTEMLMILSAEKNAGYKQLGTREAIDYVYKSVDKFCGSPAAKFLGLSTAYQIAELEKGGKEMMYAKMKRLILERIQDLQDKYGVEAAMASTEDYTKELTNSMKYYTRQLTELQAAFQHHHSLLSACANIIKKTKAICGALTIPVPDEMQEALDKDTGISTLIDSYKKIEAKKEALPKALSSPYFATALNDLVHFVCSKTKFPLIADMIKKINKIRAADPTEIKNVLDNLLRIQSVLNTSVNHIKMFTTDGIKHDQLLTLEEHVSIMSTNLEKLPVYFTRAEKLLAQSQEKSSLPQLQASCVKNDKLLTAYETFNNCCLNIAKLAAENRQHFGKSKLVLDGMPPLPVLPALGSNPTASQLKEREIAQKTGLANRAMECNKVYLQIAAILCEEREWLSFIKAKLNALDNKDLAVKLAQAEKLLSGHIAKLNKPIASIADFAAAMQAALVDFRTLPSLYARVKQYVNEVPTQNLVQDEDDKQGLHSSSTDSISDLIISPLPSRETDLIVPREHDVPPQANTLPNDTLPPQNTLPQNTPVAPVVSTHQLKPPGRIGKAVVGALSKFGLLKTPENKANFSYGLGDNYTNKGRTRKNSKEDSSSELEKSFF